MYLHLPFRKKLSEAKKIYYDNSEEVINMKKFRNFLAWKLNQKGFTYNMLSYIFGVSRQRLNTKVTDISKLQKDAELNQVIRDLFCGLDSKEITIRKLNQVIPDK